MRPPHNPNSCTGTAMGNTRVVITTGVADRDAILSLATTAMVSEKKVNVWEAGCWASFSASPCRN